MLMLGVFPFAASAGAPSVARISATSYLDAAGTEYDSICEQDNNDPGSLTASVNYSGIGSELPGSGTGELAFSLFFEFLSFDGPIDVNGLAIQVYGAAEMICFGSGYALLVGEFQTFPVEEESLPSGLSCGSLAGYIMDGAHRNQGRLSLTLTFGCED